MFSNHKFCVCVDVAESHCFVCFLFSGCCSSHYYHDYFSIIINICVLWTFNKYLYTPLCSYKHTRFYVAINKNCLFSSELKKNKTAIKSISTE